MRPQKNFDFTVSASTSMSSLRDTTTTTIYSTPNSSASGISMGSPRNKTKSILKQKVIYQGVLSTDRVQLNLWCERI